MLMKNKLLDILKKNENLFVSGQTISEELGVTRAAIWKYISKLKEEGYIIEAQSRNGYKLTSSPDILTWQEINKYLSTKYIGKNIIHFDTIDSTNTKAKELAANGIEDGTIIISEEQTAGRGRFGRQWSSPKYKGIWFSVVLKPLIDPINASNITLIGAAAVCLALKDLGIDTKIKWPNDILLNDKKVCGILTEMSSELNQINYLVMGIGINVNTSYDEFPRELTSSAASLKSETNAAISRQKLLASILEHFENLYDSYIKDNNLKSIIDVCRINSSLIGKKIQLYQKGVKISAKAIDITENGLLTIEHEDGHLENIISGEVSMHGL
jgi:BirA family biotin operon repressor/biotin-[acetyl-CoA-carboxylase] ligase